MKSLTKYLGGRYYRIKYSAILVLGLVLTSCDQGEEYFTLSNSKITATWSRHEGVLLMQSIQNHLDNSARKTLDSIALFTIETTDGRKYTNRDFQLSAQPEKSQVKPTDSLPSKGLSLTGEMIEAVLVNKALSMQVRWKAILRENTNYVKQQFSIHYTGQDSLFVSKVGLWNGRLEGATPAGEVLGSVITKDNIFFGYEHPTAYSEALDYRYVTYYHDPTQLINRQEGNYELSLDITDKLFENGIFQVDFLPSTIRQGFNIRSIALLENDVVISEDEHSMYGNTSQNSYMLDIPSKKQEAQYKLKVMIIGPQDCAGDFYIKQIRDDHLGFYTKKELFLKPEQPLKEYSVVGVSEPHKMRRAFLAYIETERARPYSQFLHYNSWYDLSEDNVSYNLNQAKSVIEGWGRKFIDPYKVQFGGFALDDGWDDLNDLWRFNREDFPNGFKPLAEKARTLNTGIGAWMSPFGGYAEPKKRRVATARRDGFETTDKGLSLAGPNYYNRFLESALTFIRDHEVNYFKFDGFGGADSKYLPEMEAATRLVRELRKAKPDVFVNVTTGTWPSPFWLLTTDCTWRGGWDVNQAGVGNKSQQWITYRDGMLYNNVVKRAPLYPLNSIMHHGIVYANRSWGKQYTTDSDKDFADQVYSYFGSGTSLQELYISHDRMNESKWKILAQGAQWAKANENVLVDTHWIGGDPFNLDVYGWASWSGEKGIIVLRNPSDKDQYHGIELEEILETSRKEWTHYQWSEPFKTTKKVIDLNEEVRRVKLSPFEVKVIEIVSQ